MAHATMTRETLIGRIAAVFRAHGYEGASLTRLAKATGLVRASLYYQFPRGKEDMAEAVLTGSGEAVTREVLIPLADESLSPAARLEAVVAGLDRFYEGGRAACLIEAFGIGEAGERFRPILTAKVDTLIAAFASVSRAAGVEAAEAARRGEQALIAIQGSLVVSRALGDRGPFKRTIAGLSASLLA